MVAAGSALFLVPWQLWVGAYGSELPPVLQGKYGPYGSWLADGYREGGIDFARKVLVKNLASVGNTLSYLVMPVPLGVLRQISLLLLVPTVLSGLVLAAKRAPVLITFCVAYLALIIVWPFHPYRFVLALWPVLIMAVAALIRALWGRRPRGSVPAALRFAALGVVGYLAAGHLAYNWVELREKSYTDLQKGAGESAKPLLEWVVRYTNPDDVLSTEHDVVVYLYTGRRGVPVSTFLASQRVKRFTATDDAHWMRIMVDTFQPRYLITGWPAHVTAADSLSTDASPVLRRLGSIPSHIIYERVDR
jgi:hypothetical protein